MITASLASSSLQVAGQVAYLPELLAQVAVTPGPATSSTPGPHESRQATALEILSEHGTMPSAAESCFRAEWRSLRSKLEALCLESGSTSETASFRLLDRRLNSFFSLGAHFTAAQLLYLVKS